MELHSFLEHTKQRCDSFLKSRIEALPAEPADLREAVEYALLLGGKRVRPFLVYASGRAFNASERKLDFAAAAVECIHAFSLVHDDMPEMDNDLLRRGSPTVHAKFGAATALLAGDALQAMAFELLTDPDFYVSDKTKAALCSALAKASGFRGMCGGQALDLAAEHQKTDREALEKLHSLKTGALITCAVKMGFLVAEDAVNSDGYEDRLTGALKLVEAWPRERILKALEIYGAKTGLAFQVRDDVLDVIGSEEKIGKTVGSDEAKDKSTYVVLMGAEEASAYALKLAAEAEDALRSLSADTSLLRDFAYFCAERDH